MQDPPEKLTGKPLIINQMIEYLPALKEVPRSQPDNWAKGAALLQRGDLRVVLPGRPSFAGVITISRLASFFAVLFLGMIFRARSRVVRGGEVRPDTLRSPRRRP